MESRPDSTPKGGLTRWIAPTMYLNAVILVVVAIPIFYLQLPALAKAEPIFATRLGGFYLAFAVTLLILARDAPRDRRLLWVPILFNLAEFLNALVQLVLRTVNANVPTDPALAPPLILTGIFLLFYVIAYAQSAG